MPRPDREGRDVGDWKGFERLAERIAGDLHPNATVTWNDHLPGRFTEKKRQIDVSIRWSDGDREQLTIVQARDRSRPADVNAIGEFVAVVEDVGASRGVMVCRSGFAKDAKTYARNKGIALYNLHDAESRDWRLELTIPLLWIDLHPSADFPCRIHLNKGEQLPLEDNEPVLHVPGGPRIHPAAVFEQLWNERAIPDTPVVRHTIQSAPLCTPVMRVDGQAEWREVDLQVVYEVERRAWLGQFTPNQCRGLLDYLDNDAFTASHLPIGEIPTERNDQWVEIDDPDGIAVRVRGTLVTTIGYQLAPGALARVETTMALPGLPPERLPD
jgi:Restriction endonuclease